MRTQGRRDTRPAGGVRGRDDLRPRNKWSLHRTADDDREAACAGATMVRGEVARINVQY